MEEAKPQSLLWTAPDFPFEVTVLADVLNEARILAVEAFYSVPRGGVEVGGVFFGVRDGASLHIQAHRQIRCEYATGPSFTLSVKDQLGLSGLLDQAPEDPDLAGMSPLGWYHSHTRSEIFLSPVDVQLYNDFFHERWQIALVLRPVNLQPTRAGFFFRDRLGNLKSDAPLQEFKLEPPDFGLTLLDAQGAPVAPRVAAATAAAAPAPAAESPAAPRLVLVPPPAVSAPPVGSLPVSPLPEVVPAATALEAEALSPEPPSRLALVAASNGSVEYATPVPAVAAPVSEARPVSEVRAEIPTPAPLPEPLWRTPQPNVSEVLSQSVELAAARARARRLSGWVWGLVLALLLLVAGGAAAYFKWGAISKPPGLGLEAYDMNGAFLIRWDRECAAIRQANHGTLEIEDGDEKAPIELGPAELAVGGYGYMRRTAQVSVRMSVDGPKPAEEYWNFKSARPLGPAPAQPPADSNALSRALQEKEHLKTELINESMQTSDLRREVDALRRQLAEARARNSSSPDR